MRLLVSALLLATAIQALPSKTKVSDEELELYSRLLKGLYDLSKRDDSENESPETGSDDTQTNGARNPASNSILENVDDEGLDTLQQIAADFIETRTGERRVNIHRPANLDENDYEARLQQAQKELNSRGVESTEFKHLMTKAVVETGKSFDEIINLLPDGKELLHHFSTAKRSGYAGYRGWEGGILPYEFDPGVNGKARQDTIDAMKYIEQRSCIKFYEYNSGLHSRLGLNHNVRMWFINKGSRCYSYVGRTNFEKQEIAPCGGYGIGTPLHELLHALGALHEQSRADRDQYLQVLFSRILSDNAHNFNKENTDGRIPYDYGSIMQYRLTSFSTNPYQDAMKIYNNYLDFLPGSRNEMGFYDIQDLNLEYQCTQKKCPGVSLNCQNGGYMAVIGGSCKCNCPFGLGGSTCTSVTKNCGSSIQSVSSSNPTVYVQSPSYPSPYPANRECVWLVKAPENDFLKISFDELDLTSGYYSCQDSIEVRHNLIGQPGERYCGNYFKASRVSSSNSILLVLRTDGNSNSAKGFRAKITYVPRSSFSFDLSNNGESYRGSMDYTHHYEKCVPWTSATNCAVNPTTHSGKGLGSHNYCRNPTQSRLPWCYTDGANCVTDFCDIDLLNDCHDKRADCNDLKSNDAGYCGKTEAFTNCHKTCGFCQDGGGDNGGGDNGGGDNGGGDNGDGDNGGGDNGGGDNGGGDNGGDDNGDEGTLNGFPLECYKSEKGTEYVGKLAVNRFGNECKKWSETSYGTRTFPDGSTEAASNYCRNPDSDVRPWCWDKTGGWGYCEVPKCADACKTSEKGTEFRGKVTITRNGKKCIKWSESGMASRTTFPEGSAAGAVNYCRNPDSDAQPWCYIDQNGRWEFCNIPFCSDNKRGISSKVAEDVLKNLLDVKSGADDLPDKGPPQGLESRGFADEKPPEGMNREIGK